VLVKKELLIFIREHLLLGNKESLKIMKKMRRKKNILLMERKNIWRININCMNEIKRYLLYETDYHNLY